VNDLERIRDPWRWKAVRSKLVDVGGNSSGFAYPSVSFRFGAMGQAHTLMTGSKTSLKLSSASSLPILPVHQLPFQESTVRGLTGNGSSLQISPLLFRPLHRRSELGGKTTCLVNPYPLLSNLSKGHTHILAPRTLVSLLGLVHHDEDQSTPPTFQSLPLLS